MGSAHRRQTVGLVAAVESVRINDRVSVRINAHPTRAWAIRIGDKQ